MYLTKTVYGLLSFPFIVFIFPFITLLLTKSRDTGFDKYGNCVPQIADLKEYHRTLEKKKDAAFDKRYTKAPERKITLIEEEPLLEEII